MSASRAPVSMAVALGTTSAASACGLVTAPRARVLRLAVTGLACAACTSTIGSHAEVHP